MKNYSIDEAGKRYRFYTSLPIVGDIDGLIFTKYQLESDHIAEHLYNIIGDFPVADLCCGVGMTSVALAKYFSFVIGVDSKRSRLDAGMQNSKTFGVNEHIKFIRKDVTKQMVYKFLKKHEVRAITIDPGWRGNSLTRELSDVSNPTISNIKDTQPPILDIFHLMQSVTPNICVRLPNTIDLSSIMKLGKCEIEEIYYEGMESVRYFDVYFGDLVLHSKSSFTVPISNFNKNYTISPQSCFNPPCSLALNMSDWC